MKLPPLDVILTWPAPNYTNPITRGDALVIINSIFIVLVTITVGLRMYTRLVIKRWFGIDDVFILLALLFTAGLTAIVLLANKRYGWDRHIYDIPFDKLEPTLKIAMAAKVVFTAAATFTRLSLHCFYYRLVQDTGKSWFRWCIHLNVMYTIGIMISYTFIAVFLCTPVSDYWKIGSPEGSCLDEGVATLVCGIINCIADLATTITPLPLVMGLHMPLRQRLAVGMLFSMGMIVTIAGIIRTWFIYKSLIAEYDNTWYAFPLWIAAAVEIDLGVICASAPVLRPLISKIPFSLSGSFSSGFTLPKKSTASYGKPSRPSMHPGTDGSQTLVSSRRKFEPIKMVPELSKDKGRSYELKDWGEEPTAVSREPSRRLHTIADTGSDSDSQQEGGFRKMLKKIGVKDPYADKDDMTITMTSEIELQIEPASQSRSRENLRREPSRPQNQGAMNPSSSPGSHWV